jgi:glutathione S-transferase
LFFLEEAKIPYEPVYLDLFKGEHLAPEMLKINPNHQVPFIVDEGFTVWETNAILRYLATKFKVDDHWYPADLKARTEVDKFLDWRLGHLLPSYINIMFQTLFAGSGFAYKDESTRKCVIEETKPKLMEQCNSLDKWLAASAYIAGKDISIADLGLWPALTHFELVELDFLTGRPNLARWYKAVGERAVTVKHNVAFEMWKADTLSKKKDAPESKDVTK